MASLSLDLFLGAGRDLEQTQYQVLGRLQQIQQDFSQNIIYPHLTDLITLYATLQRIVDQLGDIREARPGPLKGVDLEAQRLVYERMDAGKDDMGPVEDLITWSLPHIQKAIEEGRTIFEFVEENLRLEEIGIVPSYLEEGYLIVPDRRQHALHVLHYSLSIFTGAEERYRSLKTRHVKAIRQRAVVPSPRSIKLDLMAENRELPNPATYLFDTDLDFPYEQTMLPVAKRKLMRYLSTRTGFSFERADNLFRIMMKDKLSDPEKVDQLKEELSYHHRNDVFQKCKTMGEIVVTNVQLLLQKEFKQSILVD